MKIWLTSSPPALTTFLHWKKKVMYLTLQSPPFVQGHLRHIAEFRLLLQMSPINIFFLKFLIHVLEFSYQIARCYTILSSMYIFIYYIMYLSSILHFQCTCLKIHEKLNYENAWFWYISLKISMHATAAAGTTIKYITWLLYLTNAIIHVQYSAHTGVEGSPAGMNATCSLQWNEPSVSFRQKLLQLSGWLIEVDPLVSVW